jgi:hypothetical protein
MLTDTQTLGTTTVTFTRRVAAGQTSQFVPSGDTPANERKLRVGHEVTKSGTVNTLYAVSHVKLDAASPTGATALASVQVKIIRPRFVSAADMSLIVDQVKTGLTTTVINALLNQEA